MSSSAAQNTAACVSAAPLQSLGAAPVAGMPHVLLWEPSTSQPAGAGGGATPAGLQALGNMPQPVETLDEREVKRMRRKQNNRESARRSRQRKADEITQLTEQVAKRNADVVLLQETVTLLAQHVKQLSQQVKDLGGSVDVEVEARADVSHVLAQTSERAHASEPTAEPAAGVHESRVQNGADQEPVQMSSARIQEIGPGQATQSAALQPASGT